MWIAVISHSSVIEIPKPITLLHQCQCNNGNIAKLAVLDTYKIWKTLVELSARPRNKWRFVTVYFTSAVIKPVDLSAFLQRLSFACPILTWKMRGREMAASTSETNQMSQCDQISSHTHGTDVTAAFVWEKSRLSLFFSKTVENRFSRIQ